jgi:hypothetical protein
VGWGRCTLSNVGIISWLRTWWILTSGAGISFSCPWASEIQVLWLVPVPLTPQILRNLALVWELHFWLPWFWSFQTWTEPCF